MNKWVLGTLALAAAAAGPAFAADLPVKAPPLIVTYNWSGCYVGANGGWKWGRFRDSADVPTTTGNVPGIGTLTAPLDRVDLGRTNGDSGAIGAQIGCRWETAGHWVYGIEGDFDWTNLRATTAVTAPSGIGTTFVPGDSFTDRMRWESSVRGIVGRSFDRILLYATGGIAFAGVKMDANFIPTIGVFTNGAPGPYPASAGSDSKVLVGFTVGAGAAYALSKNWDIGAEYRFTSYQKGDFNLGSVAGICGPTTAIAGGVGCLNQTVTGHKDLQTSEVLFKLNYRFDWAGPIVARY